MEQPEAHPAPPSLRALANLLSGLIRFASAPLLFAAPNTVTVQSCPSRRAS